MVQRLQALCETARHHECTHLELGECPLTVSDLPGLRLRKAGEFVLLIFMIVE